MNKIESLKEEEIKYIVIQVLGFFLKKKIAISNARRFSYNVKFYQLTC